MSEQSTQNGVVLQANSLPMGEKLIRQAQLKKWMEARGWGPAETARHSKTKRTAQQISNLVNGFSSFGEKVARSLEDDLGMDRYYLDDRTEESAKVPGVAEAQAPYSLPKKGGLVGLSPADTNGPVAVPLISWAQIDLMSLENSSAVLARLEHHIPADTTSSRAKALIIGDDANSPDLLPGDRVVLDPAEAPRAGDIVLVETKAGEKMLRRYRPRTGAVFEAVPGNENYATLRSDEDGLAVVAVMVEYTRKRRA